MQKATYRCISSGGMFNMSFPLWNSPAFPARSAEMKAAKCFSARMNAMWTTTNPSAQNNLRARVVLKSKISFNPDRRMDYKETSGQLVYT